MEKNLNRHHVSLSSSLSKESSVKIDDENQDYADIDWKGAAVESDILTPAELIEMLKHKCEIELMDYEDNYNSTGNDIYLEMIEDSKYLIDQCNGWIEDEWEVIP